MTTLDKATGVSSLVTGALLTAFGLFSIMGVFTSGIMTLFRLAEGEVSARLLGLVVLVFRAVWRVAYLVASPLQALADTRLFQGRPPAASRWLASVAGLAATVTVYCALMSSRHSKSEVLQPPASPALVSVSDAVIPVSPVVGSSPPQVDTAMDRDQTVATRRRSKLRFRVGLELRVGGVPVVEDTAVLLVQLDPDRTRNRALPPAPRDCRGGHRPPSRPAPLDPRRAGPNASHGSPHRPAR